MVRDKSHHQRKVQKNTAGSIGSESVNVADACGFWSVDVDTIRGLTEAYRTAANYDGSALINCNMTTSVPDEYPEPDYVRSYLKHRFRSVLSE